MPIHNLTIKELTEKLNNGEVTPADVMRGFLERIESVDERVGAFIHLDNGVLSQRVKDIEQSSAAKGSLWGVPVAVKDNICVNGELTRCASKILEGFKPPYDATVVGKLKQAGVLLMGKVNMDEFAFGSSCETSAYKTTRNPWNLECAPGGSSGGAAAAVASEEVPAALGSDTGGSIRQPAALCGIVGFKPTYGRVSRYGLIAFASSLDQVGTLTKNVEDSALLMNVISGYDEMDSTSVDIPVPDYTASLGRDIKGLRIGIPKEYFADGMDKEVKDAVWEAVRLLESKGAIYKEVSLPSTEYALPVYYIVAVAEASSNLARFDGVHYGYRAEKDDELLQMNSKTRDQGFGDEAKRRILLGTYALSSGYYEAYYLRAQKVRTLIKRDFDRVFEEFDCLLTPTSPTPAFKIGERVSDPLTMYLSDIFTIPANLAGLPAISIPCGFTDSGLPIGAQIMSKPFAEETIFRLAHSYEQATDWHKRRPYL